MNPPHPFANVIDTGRVHVALREIAEGFFRADKAGWIHTPHVAETDYSDYSAPPAQI
jgi:hypothetical protein